MHLKWQHWITLYLWRVMFSFHPTQEIWQGQSEVTAAFWGIERQYHLTGNKVSSPFVTLNCQSMVINSCFFLLYPRKALVRLFDKIEQGTLKEGSRLSDRVAELQKRRYIMQCFDCINRF